MKFFKKYKIEITLLCVVLSILLLAHIVAINIVRSCSKNYGTIRQTIVDTGREIRSIVKDIQKDED